MVRNLSGRPETWSALSGRRSTDAGLDLRPRASRKQAVRAAHPWWVNLPAGTASLRRWSPWGETVSGEPVRGKQRSSSERLKGVPAHGDIRMASAIPIRAKVSERVLRWAEDRASHARKRSSCISSRIGKSLPSSISSLGAKIPTESFSLFCRLLIEPSRGACELGLDAPRRHRRDRHRCTRGCPAPVPGGTVRPALNGALFAFWVVVGRTLFAAGVGRHVG